MVKDPETKGVMDEIMDLLKGQRLAVISTEGEMGPYTNIVSFTSTGNLKAIYFATTRSTRKYANLKTCNMVSLLVDDRTCTEDDLFSTRAVTAIGRTTELEGKEKEEAISIMAERHPSLIDFLGSPGSATIRIDVHRYLLVTNFQNVREVIFHDENDNPSV